MATREKSTSAATDSSRPERTLFKTTIVIWSEYDTSGVELDILARDAITGEAYCSKQECDFVQVPEKDKDWDGTEFFD